MEAPECGAAALGSVLGYFGRMEPLEKLRIECGVSRNGSNALNIVKAARRYGLVAKGRRTDIEGLFRLPLPAILFWNFNHFVVLEGFSRDFVYLNDPATGPRRITYDELDASYTGIALTFELGPDFRPGREQPSLYSLLRQRLAGAEWGLAYVAFVSLALVIPGIVAPAFTRIFVDDILLAGNRHWLGPLILGMILTMLVQGGLTWIQQTYLLRLYRRLGRAHSGRFFWHLLHLPLDFYAQRYGGEVANRLQLNDSVASLLSGELATAVFNGVTMLFFAAVMVAYSPLLAAVGIVSALLNLAFLRWMSRSRIDDNARLLQEQGKVIAATLMGLRSMETVKAGGGAIHELEIYVAVNRCQGLAPGLYHYDPVHHRLRPAGRDEGAVRRLIDDARRSAPVTPELQVLIILATRFERIGWKYESMAYALTLKNAGAALQTMYLVATAMGLAPVAVGAGNADLFARAAGTDYYAETSVAEFLLGTAAPEHAPPFLPGGRG